MKLTYRLFLLIMAMFCVSIFFFSFNLHRYTRHISKHDFNLHCFPWQSADHRSFTSYECRHRSEMDSIIWTHSSSGFMKYLQWIVIRKIANIRITHLDNDCCITHVNEYFSIQRSNQFIQIYLIPLSANFTYQSKCTNRIKKIDDISLENTNHIYFTRRSVHATVFYAQLDALTNVHRECSFQLSNTLIQNVQQISHHLSALKWAFVYDEDFVHETIDESEDKLRYLFSLLRLNQSNSLIEYDSHRFLADATWWDQSHVAENIINEFIPTHRTKLIYVNDFYYLHGSQSFLQYMYKNRQCYTHGIFTQLQFETKKNRISTDIPNRCLRKPFDCAFSDIYSFSDREQLYEQFDNKKDFNEKSIKCGFAVSSIFDRVRERYARNQTCQTIIFTSISNCYDPLPEVEGIILPSFCFVALLDTKTINAYKEFYANRSTVAWDLVDLGRAFEPFSIAAKTAETLKIVGEHLFPVAKWIIWLDGKGRLNSIDEVLIQAQTPFIAAPHPALNRTSESEVNETLSRLRSREKPFSFRMNISVADIRLQEKQYKHDGFYRRSEELKLKMYDIAIFLYRNNHPCISRYLCGWHNEINYYSYRGQLSVYYSAVRLNLTKYLAALPLTFFSTVNHQAVC